MNGSALFWTFDWLYVLPVFCWLLSMPGIACSLFYAVLRLSGTIRIGPAGLQVGALAWRGRVIISAGYVYCRFKELCERELAVWLALGRLARGGPATEGVVDVEVETIAL